MRKICKRLNRRQVFRSIWPTCFVFHLERFGAWLSRCPGVPLSREHKFCKFPAILHKTGPRRLNHGLDSMLQTRRCVKTFVSLLSRRFVVTGCLTPELESSETPLLLKEGWTPLRRTGWLATP